VLAAQHQAVDVALLHVNLRRPAARSLIHHAQITHLPHAERRRYALTGPRPPDWHANGRPAPWITPRIIAEGNRLAGTTLITAPRVPVPPGQNAPPPAQTPPTVPPWDTAREAPPAPADQVLGSAGDLVVGIAAAASYLGYDKPDSFRRARTRHPIPGETRTTDGRPACTPAALQAWRTAPGIAAIAREPRDPLPALRPPPPRPCGTPNFG
jgi:hypothetical protein